MIVSLFVQVVATMAVFAALLFGVAGTLAWPGAWVFIAELGASSLGIGLWLARRDPALLAERLRPPAQRGQSGWDRAFMLLALVGFAAWTAFMAWDWRRGRHLPVWLEALGFVLIAVCMGLCLMTFAANSYAAPVVKLQPGQCVATSGPYRFVRHPMYASAILFFVGVPLLLGVWRGLTVIPLMVVFLAVRAVGEERLLIGGLEGYADYARRVRYRFAPFLW